MSAPSSTHPVPCATTVSRLSSHRDRMVAHLMKAIDRDHRWHRELSAQDRSWVGLVAQASIDAFIDWCREPASSASTSQEIFAVAPAELTRKVSLHQTVAASTLTLSEHWKVCCSLQVGSSRVVATRRDYSIYQY
jgi:hypothetical protein